MATKLHNQMTGADLHPNAIDGTTGTELTAPSLTVLEAVAQPWHAPCTVVRMNVHALVRDERWALVEPLLPPPRRTRRAALAGCRTGPRGAGSSTSSRPGCAGTTCRSRSAAAAVPPAGDGSETGKRRACGRVCTGCSWTSAARPGVSTGAAPAWTAPASGLQGGRGDRGKPDGPRHTGHAAPYGGRPARAPAGRGPDRGGAPGRDRLRGARGGHPGGQAARRGAAHAPSEATRRHGVRRATVPPLSGTARHRGP